MACGVIVLDISERRLSWKQAVLREIFTIVSVAASLIVEGPDLVRGLDPYRAEAIGASWWFLGPSAFLGFVEVATFLATKKHRALHDFIAGSVVIRKP
jgi:uncharacterized RDD family membrane protein YckC